MAIDPLEASHAATCQMGVPGLGRCHLAGQGRQRGKYEAARNLRGSEKFGSVYSVLFFIVVSVAIIIVVIDIVIIIAVVVVIDDINIVID